MNESTQSFKDWGQEISEKLAAAGFEKTGDSGTIYFYTPSHIQSRRRRRAVITAAALLGGFAIGALGAMLWVAEFI